MTLVWRPGFQFDADASTYIEAVEAADTQALETGVRYAINDFVIGCKQDGIWSAIKASCILAGARTLDGALVPLTGTAPTNNNFVSGDYNRKTGLAGNGSNKYLISNRYSNSDPQNSHHMAVYKAAGSGNGNLIGQSGSPLARDLIDYNSQWRFNSRSVSSVTNAAAATTNGFIGLSRSSSSTIYTRIGGAIASQLVGSSAPDAIPIYVFSRGVNDFPTASRLSFYSIGESLDLAALDTRVSALITAIGAAIP
jgi:hypothetical protein